jgi:hypothetical protein
MRRGEVGVARIMHTVCSSPSGKAPPVCPSEAADERYCSLAATAAAEANENVAAAAGVFCRGQRRRRWFDDRVVARHRRKDVAGQMRPGNWTLAAVAFRSFFLSEDKLILAVVVKPLSKQRGSAGS